DLGDQLALRRPYWAPQRFGTGVRRSGVRAGGRRARVLQDDRAEAALPAVELGEAERLVAVGVDGGKTPSDSGDLAALDDRAQLVERQRAVTVAVGRGEHLLDRLVEPVASDRLARAAARLALGQVLEALTHRAHAGLSVLRIVLRQGRSRRVRRQGRRCEYEKLAHHRSLSDRRGLATGSALVGQAPRPASGACESGAFIHVPDGALARLAFRGHLDLAHAAPGRRDADAELAPPFRSVGTVEIGRVELETRVEVFIIVVGEQYGKA